MPSRAVLLLAVLAWADCRVSTGAGGDRFFEPAHRILGIGAGRADLSEVSIARVSERMIESQTFAMLRDPRALAGAKRIFSPQLKRVFDRSARASGLDSSFIAAIAYLESFGDARAQSPTGPRGIMQISAGTARRMGLKVVYAKRYKIETRTVRVRSRQGKRITKRVWVRVPYQVLVRDDRMVPARAVPAAARYLAGLSAKFGGLDWATFAYHCGEGCAATMRKITAEADGIAPPYTVAKMFFGANPAVNRDLYAAIEKHMRRDQSPTYWFRVMRARQLLALYRKDPKRFRQLAAKFRYAAAPPQRAPHRLAVWLTGSESGLQSCDQLRHAVGSGIDRLDDPDYYGFRIGGAAALRKHCQVPSRSAIGTVAYIAFETRRLHEAMDVKGERFVPFEVISLVKPAGTGETDVEAALHSTGHVFSINYAKMPPGQRQAFEFVLKDLGWAGYLGFIRASSLPDTLHIGCSPKARDFFEAVFADIFEETGSSEDVS